MITDNDELRVVRAFRAEDAAPDPDARAAARVALLERIEAEAPAPARSAIATSIRRPRRRVLAGGLGFAASAAAAAAIVVGGSGSVQPETAKAADALRSAATVAAGGPGVTLGSGQYWYVSSESRTSSKTFTVTTPNGLETYEVVNVRERTERWIDSNGGGRTVTETIGKPQFATPDDRATWIAAGRPAADEASPWTLASPDTAKAEEPSDGWKALSGLSYGELRRLSADDNALADRLARVAAETPGKTFAFAAYLLRTTPISPAQRAALYRVMADIPGVELLGTVKDTRGRSGTGVALERDGWRVDVLFDPETALPLDFTSTATEPQATSDTEPAQHEEAFLAAGVVDSTKARP